MNPSSTGISPVNAPSAEQIFSVHPAIRWTGAITRKGTILFAENRPTVKSLTPNGEDRLFLELRPLYEYEMAECTLDWLHRNDGS